MDNQQVNIINLCLSAKSWLRVVDEVHYVAGAKFHTGKIEIDTLKGVVCIAIKVYDSFPLAKIEFYCTNHEGYGHQMSSGLLCLMATPASGLTDRLELELEKLWLWVEKYFINEEADAHFEYFKFANTLPIELIFEEDNVKEALKGVHGKFYYGLLNQFPQGDKAVKKTWLAFQLGGRKCRWTKSFLSGNVIGEYTGLWVRIDHPPVIVRNKATERWKELLPLLSFGQAQYIYDQAKLIRGQSGYTDKFMLCVGYEIPGDEGNEIHWDLLVVSFENFPYTPKKIKAGEYVPEDNGMDLAWCRTSNASYQRLFGRGKLSNALTESKVLIIGTGAIGSSLFISLVRGGCKNIHISEFDNIEPGNICRGQFSFKQSGNPKPYELYNYALSVSPYVELGFTAGLESMGKDNAGYPDQKKALNSFDFIFDCSTDKYVSIMLDEMDLKGTVINLSISNEANHMAVITGTGNIHVAKSDLYDRLIPGKQKPFFVATGCWHPTFHASYSDINILLHYAINEIDHKLEKGVAVSSFYISKSYNEFNSIVYEISYHV